MISLWLYKVHGIKLIFNNSDDDDGDDSYNG